MKDSLKERVNFEIIRYANCWEDAEVLLEGLKAEEGSKILSIGSAGDNSLSLLTTNPELLVAVDINNTQLYLIELKVACFKLLSYEEVLQFLGFNYCENRAHIFSLLKPQLSASARNYWERNSMAIETGVIYSGKFEKYLRLFSGKLLPWIHSSATVAQLFINRSASDQQKFYTEKWNSWRWKLFFKLFFSKSIMGKFGRDPEFLKEVTVPVADYIYNKAAAQLQSKCGQQNFILHFNLTGNFGSMLPLYMQKENFEIIKSNLNNLIITEGYAQDAIKKYGRFNCMNLSNIFEYMDKNLFKETAAKLIKGTVKEGRLAYWNLMVPRKIANLFPDKVDYQATLSQLLSEKDKGFFYNQLLIDKIK